MTRSHRLAKWTCLALAATPLLPAVARAQSNAQSDPPDNAVVAQIGPVKVTRQELYQPLVDAYGLNLLLSLVRLDMAEHEAQQRGMTVSPQDISDERTLTLAKMFAQAKPEDYEAYLKQFLEQQHLTGAEFDLVLKTNAYLRKLAAPMVQGRLTEDDLRTAFNARYGETVKVRHIALQNLQQVAEAQRRLKAGESFADLARAMSLNKVTGPQGGEIQPFSRSNTAMPQLFRDASFALQKGQVSDPIQVEGLYHLIMLEAKIPPKAVKYEDVKQSLRQDLDEELTFEAMKRIRDEFGRQALQSLDIRDPALKQQFEARIADQKNEIRDPNQIRQELDKEHAPAAGNPAIRPK